MWVWLLTRGCSPSVLTNPLFSQRHNIHSDIVAFARDEVLVIQGRGSGVFPNRESGNLLDLGPLRLIYLAA